MALVVLLLLVSCNVMAARLNLHEMSTKIIESETKIEGLEQRVQARVLLVKAFQCPNGNQVSF